MLLLACSEPRGNLHEPTWLLAYSKKTAAPKQWMNYTILNCVSAHGTNLDKNEVESRPRAVDGASQPKHSLPTFEGFLISKNAGDHLHKLHCSTGSFFICGYKKFKDVNRLLIKLRLFSKESFEIKIKPEAQWSPCHPQRRCLRCQRVSQKSLAPGRHGWKIFDDTRTHGRTIFAENKCFLKDLHLAMWPADRAPLNHIPSTCGPGDHFRVYTLPYCHFLFVIPKVVHQDMNFWHNQQSAC